MNITINGDVYVTQYGELLGIGGSGVEEVETPFDDFDGCDDECDDDCDGCCEDCEYNEDDDDFTLDDLLDEYVDILTENCICPECIKDALKQYTSEFVNMLMEDEII